MEINVSISATQVVWVARHSHIGDAFFDLDAAEYLLNELRGDAAMSDILVSIIVFSAMQGGPTHMNVCISSTLVKVDDLQPENLLFGCSVLEALEVRGKQEKREAPWTVHAAHPMEASLST